MIDKPTLLKEMQELEVKMLHVSGYMKHFNNDSNIHQAAKINKKATELKGAAVLLKEWIEEIKKDES